MKTINLVRKPMKFGGRFEAPAGSPGNPGGQQRGNYLNVADGNPNLQFIHICRRFNNDIESYSNCWYFHICNEWKKKKHVKKNCKNKWFIKNFKMNIFYSSFQNHFHIFSSIHQHFSWRITIFYEWKNEKNDCKNISTNCTSTFFIKSSLMGLALATQVRNNELSVWICSSPRRPSKSWWKTSKINKHTIAFFIWIQFLNTSSFFFLN